MTDDTGIPRDLPRTVVGLSIVLAGILFLLDNLHLVRAGAFLHYWPVVLVAIGVVKIAQTSSWGGYAWSLVWIIAGAWLLGWNIGLITISIWTLWPVLLVLLGVGIIRRACCPPQAAAASLSSAPPTASDSMSASPPAASDLVGSTPVDAGRAPARDSYVRAVAVMAGLERASDSTDFRGADLVAIMGGCELDLRQATIAGEQAVIDVMAFMGGIEIYVPRTWAIEAKVLPFMGGVGDETRQDRSGPMKRLVIRGLALMGGVEIKN